jgi:hypothetical protein
MTTQTAAVDLVATTPAAIMFPVPLIVEYVDGRVWRVVGDFFFHSPAPDVFPSIGVPAGFETNFASIPRAFWSVLSPTHAHIARIAVIHDRFYHAPWIPITRAQADDALRAGMQALGASWWQRTTCFRMVRWFGGGFEPRELP